MNDFYKTIQNPIKKLTIYYRGGIFGNMERRLSASPVKTFSKELSDDKIIELYWNRDENAVSETDKKYGVLLLRIAVNILNDKMDGEECKNDTYLSLWNRIPPTRPRNLCAFAAKIIRRIAINRYYHENRKSAVSSSLKKSMEECEAFLSSPSEPENSLLAKELGEIINAYLSTLSERQRYVFMGRFWFADPVRTIASELRVSESSVYKELQEIKKDFRSFLKSKGVTV